MTWRNGLLAILGAWFVVAAWVLNPRDSQVFFWSPLVLGGFTASGGVYCVFRPWGKEWVYKIEALGGFYLALSPFIYGKGPAPREFWVTVLTGGLLLVGGLWQAWTPDAPHDSGLSPGHRAAS